MTHDEPRQASSGSRPARCPLLRHRLPIVLSDQEPRTRCPGSRIATAPGFMRHITIVHAGQHIDSEVLDVLIGLERGVCTGQACGAFVRLGTTRCHHCSESTILRPPCVGDTIQGAAGSSPQSTDQTQANGQTYASSIDSQSSPIPPADFTKRIRKLKSNSLIHLPLAHRNLLLRTSIECIEGFSALDPDWSTFEEGGTKLMLTNFPNGCHIPREIAIRCDLWKRRQYGELLVRVEKQVRGNAINRRAKRKELKHKRTGTQEAKGQSYCSRGGISQGHYLPRVRAGGIYSGRG